MENTTSFKRFGIMLDCSRNAVATVDSLKKWIDITTDLGYNTLMLYTEDTYEVPDNPYFGYMRGRYSCEELKEVDAYAKKKGMELIPCIQTLAHLNAIVRWPEYQPHFDIDDILLAEDDRVYELIDSMFKTLSSCFTTRIAHIGMDEAHNLGRGRYLDQHGMQNRFEIMTKHLKKVCDIGAKYGFRFLMWSDMFFRLATGGKYSSDAKISDEIKKQIPENVDLVYWDYYSTDKSHYDQMFVSHEQLKSGTWFAGGLWSWAGLAPHNGYSMRSTEAALTSSKDHRIENVILTMWGDNGGECSRYALLPSLFYASELAKGNTDLASIKALFEEKYGIPYDTFMLLDLPGTPDNDNSGVSNPEKYLLYTDCFLGLFDRNLNGHEKEQFDNATSLLTEVLDKGAAKEWSYLFASMRDLSAVLAVKADLGVRTHEAYKSGDKETVKALLPVYDELSKKLEAFYHSYKKQWLTDNKPFGLEVQDARLGALMNRVHSCHDRLEDYCEGRIAKIEELEAVQLDYCGGGDIDGQDKLRVNNWCSNISTSIV